MNYASGATNVSQWRETLTLFQSYRNTLPEETTSTLHIIAVEILKLPSENDDTLRARAGKVLPESFLALSSPEFLSIPSA